MNTFKIKVIFSIAISVLGFDAMIFIPREEIRIDSPLAWLVFLAFTLPLFYVITAQDPNKRQMREMNKTSEKVNDPLYCPTCNTNPDFEEIWDGAYQCKNCGTVIDEDGNILEEGEESSPNTEDDFFDDEKEAEEE